MCRKDTRKKSREAGTKNVYTGALVRSEGWRILLSKPFLEHPESEFDLVSGGKSWPPFAKYPERA